MPIYEASWGANKAALLPKKVQYVVGVTGAHLIAQVEAKNLSDRQEQQLHWRCLEHVAKRKGTIKDRFLFVCKTAFKLLVSIFFMI